MLRAFVPAEAERLRGAFRVAHAALELRAMFLLRDELPAAAEAFAQKFDDIRRRHRVLWGSDPFAALTVSRQALRRRVEQVLLNLTLRLRAAYVERGLHDETLVPVVAESAAPLRTAAASLLELQDRPATSPKAALREIAATLDGGLWQATLARLSQARETRALPPGQAGETLLAIAELAAALRERLRALS